LCWRKKKDWSFWLVFFMNAHVLHALQYRLYTSSVPNECTISASSTCVNALRWQNNKAGTRNQRCTWIHNAWFKGSICCMNHPWNKPWKATLKALEECIFTSIPKILNLAKTHGQDMHSRVPHKPMANSQQPTIALFLARHANWHVMSWAKTRLQCMHCY